MRVSSLLALTVVFVGAPSIARAQSAAPPDAEAAYEQEAVGVRHLITPLRDGTTPDREGRALYSGRWDAFLGPDHHPIDQSAFYRIVGCDDLVGSYQHRARVKLGVSVGSGVLLAGGIIFATVAELMNHPVGAQPATGCPYPGCGELPASPQPVSPAWGLAIAGTGLVGLIVAHYLDPTPIDADEADRLARDYDRSLRDRLGVTETAARD
jgi:hypothetical protein